MGRRAGVPLGKTKHNGAISEHRAIAWLLDQGWEVFQNSSMHGGN